MRAKFLETPEQPTTVNRTCAAHACNLAGTMSHSAGEMATYYCRFHYWREPKHSAEITRRIAKNRELIDAAETIKDGHHVFDSVARKHGRDDLCAAKSRNARDREIDERFFPALHYQRVLGTLLKEIKGGMSGLQEQGERVSGNLQPQVPAMPNLNSVIGGLQVVAKAARREDGAMGGD